MPFERVIQYELNKRGLSGKMEIAEFEEMVEMADITSTGVMKQREKIKGEIYNELRNDSLKTFYGEYAHEAKLYKGYILTATDGSEFEVPNSKKTRSEYGNSQIREDVPRVLVSNSFDLLNHYILSTVIGAEGYSEIRMDEEHLRELKELSLPFPVIRVKDRGYVSFKDIYYSNKNNDKYVVRLKKTDFRKEISKMESNDEIITVEYERNRINYYKKTAPEFYEMMKESKASIGFMKKSYILILLEDDSVKQGEMIDLLSQKIEKYIVPVRPDRTYPRKRYKQNKYPINKRKSF